MGTCKFKRVMLKLSGEALAGKNGFGTADYPAGFVVRKKFSAGKPISSEYDPAS